VALTASLALGAGLLAGCPSNPEPDQGEPAPPGAGAAGSSSAPPTGSAPRQTGPAPGRVGTPAVAGTVARDLRAPWGLAFLPGGDALVSERDTAMIKRVSAGGQVTVAGEVPGVAPRGEGGLMGLAVSPNFAQDRFVYAYFTAADDNRIARMTYSEGGGLGKPQVIFRGIPKGTVHNGGRITFGPDGMLYAGTGEAGDRPLSQDRGSLGGKILRMTSEGRPAPGNPFGDSAVWSYGHRNVQGLAFDAAGRLWASEFGQNTWDELNLVRRGGNYGWPEVEGRAGGASQYIDPLAQWGTDDASPSGVAIVGGAAHMAALKGERLWQIPLSDDRAGTPRAFFTGELGRLRTVEPAPDGSLWLVTSNTDRRGDPRDGDDKILRVTLA
jgi:glucose/arabinose dehydrogenase